MKKVKIQKLREGELIDKYDIPIFLVQTVAKFLPTSALLELEEKGLSIDKIVALAKSNQVFFSEHDVLEDGIMTHIEVSLIN